MEYSPAEERARESIRKLDQVKADARFEERLEERFVGGAFAAATLPGRRTGAPVAAAPWLGFAAAAAILVAAGLVLNGGLNWSLNAVSGSGVMTVDGTGYSAAETETLPKRLAAGALVETDAQAGFEFLVPGVLVIEVMPGSRVMAPTIPNRWWGRSVEFGVATGEARLMTGPAFPGTELTVVTPEGTVLVTGTTIAVNRDESGTCVCVLNGTARIGTGPDDMEDVPSGMRKVMPSDGSAPFITEVKQMHLQGILKLEKRHPELR
jgi:ferric-dicitrate binding protein FerR (iron transport regulator)